MMNFLIIRRAKDCGSSATESITVNEIVRLVMVDRSNDNPTFEDASEWVVNWFTNFPSSVDSEETHIIDRLPIWTIIRVS